MSPRSGLRPLTLSGAESAGLSKASGLHVAIIMDGNGRWAKAARHAAGVRPPGGRFGVAANGRGRAGARRRQPDSKFGFSTENWSRPAQEVSELMRLPKVYFDSDLARLRREGVRVRVLGRRAGLSRELLSMIDEAEATTAANTGFRLQVAFNYGAQADIVDAARRLAEAVRTGRLDPEEINEATFGAQLSTGELTPPDLIIRTSGERRLLQLPLWETAYAELVFQDVLWPDYGPAHLAAALEEYPGATGATAGPISMTSSPPARRFGWDNPRGSRGFSGGPSAAGHRSDVLGPVVHPHAGHRRGPGRHRVGPDERPQRADPGGDRHHGHRAGGGVRGLRQTLRRRLALDADRCADRRLRRPQRLRAAAGREFRGDLPGRALPGADVAQGHAAGLPLDAFAAGGHLVGGHLRLPDRQCAERTQALATIFA